jgi:ABC-2 type transport system ATP-binding protein
MSIIDVQALEKTFKINKKSSGLRGAIKGFVSPNVVEIRAVDGISFTVEEGEILAFLGPNGAGKSTTIKMLCGILHPSAGEITVAGLAPQKKRRELAEQIGVVFGQHSQLYWDIRLGESFELLKRMYGIPQDQFDRNMGMFNELLGINELLDQSVRQLSLGQRMRADIIGAFLHNPKILFLDEPSVGLDVIARKAIQSFIKEINRTRKTTVILTTHDLSDVAKLCDRLVIINGGKIAADDQLRSLTSKVAPYKVLTVYADNIPDDLSLPKCDVRSMTKDKAVLTFNHHEVDHSEIVAALSKRMTVNDISIADPDIGDVIEGFYRRSEETEPAS